MLLYGGKKKERWQTRAPVLDTMRGSYWYVCGTREFSQTEQFLAFVSRGDFYLDWTMNSCFQCGVYFGGAYYATSFIFSREWV